YKVAFMRTRVRNGEPIVSDDTPPVQNQVNIDGAVSPPSFSGAPKLYFQALHIIKQLQRLNRRHRGGDSVQVRREVEVWALSRHGNSLSKRGGLKVCDTWNLCELELSFADRFSTVAEVRTKGKQHRHDLRNHAVVPVRSRMIVTDTSA